VQSLSFLIILIKTQKYGIFFDYDYAILFIKLRMIMHVAIFSMSQKIDMHAKIFSIFNRSLLNYSQSVLVARYEREEAFI
jgi:hypothetical protein